MMIARLPNNFSLWIVGIQSSFCHNTFSSMTCYLMAKNIKKICEMTALFSQFFTEKIWILVRKKNLDRKSCQMTACFRVFSMKRSDAKENREKTCEMTALFSWVFHRIDMNYDAKTIFWMTVFLLSRSYSTKLSDASKQKKNKRRENLSNDSFFSVCILFWNDQMQKKIMKRNLIKWQNYFRVFFTEPIWSLMRKLVNWQQHVK